MLGGSELRVRRVESDNAPFGRVTYSPSPYRWWLGLVAWFDHIARREPLGVAVERAALVANPSLQIVLLIFGTAMVARWFGSTAAILFPVGVVTLFPLATVFLPGAPDSRALSLIISLLSILPLVRSARERSTAPTLLADQNEEHRFVLGGIFGGVGLWLDLVGQGALVIGLALGGAVLAFMNRDHGKSAVTQGRRWVLWGLSGALSSLICYLIEYFPTYLDWRPEVNHPIYALAWLGLGLLVAQLEARGPQAFRPRQGKEATFLLSGILALASLPLSLWFTQRFPASDPLASRLANLPGGPTADSFGAWLRQDGVNGSVLATCAPLLAVIPILLMIRRRPPASVWQNTLVLGLGPVVATLTVACFQLQLWSMVDLAVLALAIAAAGTLLPQGSSIWVRRCSVGCVVVVAACGLLRLAPPIGRQANIQLSRLDVISLMERDVGYWLADRAEKENEVILAPPYSSVGVTYFGGLRGLGSTAWENREGVASALQIVSSTRSEEALGRLAQREVAHLVLPSWDNDLEELVKWTMPTPEDSLLSIIHRWSIPPWLTPLAYSPPTMPGFENQSVLVLRVAEDSDACAALVRRAEYFLELRQLERAEATSLALKAFPSELGAIASRAQIAKARGDNAEFTALVEDLVSQLQASPRLSIPWNQRVGLTTALALGGVREHARAQLKICLDEITSRRIRELNTRSLYQLLVLMKSYDGTFPSPEMRALALSLLPEELRLKF